MGFRRVTTTSLQKDHGASRLLSSLARAALFSLGLLTAISAHAIGTDQKVSSICKNSKDAAFRAKYCTAAKDYSQGVTTNQATSAVWTGVAATCTAACGKAVTGPLCTGASLIGSAAEGILVKKFADTVMGTGTAAGQNLLTKNAEKSAPDAAQAGTQAAAPATKFNGDACAVAGKSTLKAYEKYSQSQANEKSLGDLKKKSDDMSPTTASGGLGFRTETAPTPANNGAGSIISAATAGGLSTACTESSVKSALGAIRCATASDPTLPSYVRSEEFLKDLQKATGKSADAFFGEFESPSKSLFDSASISSLPGAAQSELGETARAMEKLAGLNVGEKLESSQGYRAASVGHSAPSYGGDDFDLNGAMAQALSGVAAGDAAENAGTANAANPAARGLASANLFLNPEDRTVSLFDRVRLRYGAIVTRDLNFKIGVK